MVVLLCVQLLYEQWQAALNSLVSKGLVGLERCLKESSLFRISNWFMNLWPDHKLWCLYPVHLLDSKTNVYWGIIFNFYHDTSHLLWEALDCCYQEPSQEEEDKVIWWLWKKGKKASCFMDVLLCIKSLWTLEDTFKVRAQREMQWWRDNERCCCLAADCGLNTTSQQ